MYTEQNNINMLFFNHKPRSLGEVKALLDANGYTGRNNPRMVRKQGAMTDMIKVAVYLEDSDFTYDWPHENYYNLRKGKLEHKPVKYDRYLDSYMTAFIQVDKGHPADLTACYIAHHNGGVPICTYRETVDQLIKFGFIVNNEFKVWYAPDIEELYFNMYNQRMYNFLT
jgi:hypothetical protein